MKQVSRACVTSFIPFSSMFAFYFVFTLLLINLFTYLLTYLLTYIRYLQPKHYADQLTCDKHKKGAPFRDKVYMPIYTYQHIAVGI